MTAYEKSEIFVPEYDKPARGKMPRAGNKIIFISPLPRSNPIRKQIYSAQKKIQNTSMRRDFSFSQSRFARQSGTYLSTVAQKAELWLR